MSSYNIGTYTIDKSNDQITLKYSNANYDEKKEKKFSVVALLVWLTLTIVPIVAFWVVEQSIPHIILWLAVFGGGGLYLYINLCKREEVKYFSIVFDCEGVHEIWNYPDKRINKTIDWNDLKYFKHFPMVVGLGKPPLFYDCIVFSFDELSDRLTRKFIRKIWKSSMQYEIKFRNFEHGIFLVCRSEYGEALYKEIFEFSSKFRTQTSK